MISDPRFFKLIAKISPMIFSAFDEVKDKLIYFNELAQKILGLSNQELSQFSGEELRNGVLKFDGQIWDFIRTPSAVFALAVDDNNTLYLGCRDGFGKIVNDGSGREIYQSLSEETEYGNDVFQVEEFEGSIYFLNEQSLFRYDVNSQKIEDQWSAGEDGIFNLAFWAEDRLFLDDEILGILELTNGKLEKAARNTPDGGLVEFWTKHPDKPEYIFGTSHENLYLIRDEDIVPIEIEDLQLVDFEIADGIWLKENLLAVATLNGGCLFIDPYAKKLNQIVNYHSGLPDNEIFAISRDLDEGLWIAHEFGFSRVAPSLPIRSFAHYPGLEGNLLGVTRFNGRIYVATSLGVFYLDEVRNYRDIVYYEQEGPTPTTRQVSPEPEDIQEPSPESDPVAKGKKKKKKRGLFSSRKKEARRASKAEEKAQAESLARVQDQEPESEVEPEPEPKKKSGFLGKLFRGKNRDVKEQEVATVRLQRKIRRELQSIRFVYKAVSGIQAKCKQMVQFHDRFLVGSNEGIYEIQDSTAILISDSPIRYLYPSENWELLMASTVDDQFITFELDEDVWREIYFFPYFRAFVQHINEDSDQNVWLAGSDKVFRIEILDDSVVMKQYPLTNQFYDEVFILNREDRTYFINSSGYSFYDPVNDKVLLDTLLEKKIGLPLEYVFDQPDNFWIHDGRIWKWLKDSVVDQIQMDYLNLFGRIQNLSFDPESNDLWVIGSDQEFYNFNLNDASDYTTNHRLFLKTVKDKGGNLLPFSNLSIQQENSQLTFEFTQPDFLGLLDLQYQYLLQGLNQEWSVWSPNNIISFHFLPPGNYSLQVKTKNAFGHIQEMEPYRFKVIPPIWKRWWFYLAEIVFFGSLVVLSFRMNRMKFKNRLLSRALTFMTLILILEFLETVVESSLNLKSSPIVDFFIEASIAFLILPIEQTLRGYLLKTEGKDSETVKQSTVSSQQ